MMPSMVNDLGKALAKTGTESPQVVPSPSCGQRLQPPAEPLDRMRCANTGCVGCPVATTHKLLRAFVYDELNKSGRWPGPHSGWRELAWPCPAEI